MWREKEWQAKSSKKNNERNKVVLYAIFRFEHDFQPFSCIVCE